MTRPRYLLEPRSFLSYHLAAARLLFFFVFGLLSALLFLEVPERLLDFHDR